MEGAAENSPDTANLPVPSLIRPISSFVYLVVGPIPPLLAGLQAWQSHRPTAPASPVPCDPQSGTPGDRSSLRAWRLQRKSTVLAGGRGGMQVMMSDRGGARGGNGIDRTHRGFATSNGLITACAGHSAQRPNVARSCRGGCGSRLRRETTTSCHACSVIRGRGGKNLESRWGQTGESTLSQLLHAPLGPPRNPPSQTSAAVIPLSHRPIEMTRPPFFAELEYLTRYQAPCVHPWQSMHAYEHLRAWSCDTTERLHERDVVSRLVKYWMRPPASVGATSPAPVSHPLARVRRWLISAASQPPSPVCLCELGENA